MDLLAEEADLPDSNCVIMNAVFTEKLDLAYDEMFVYERALVARVWDHTRSGMAFNVMSKHLDWEREDLFHLPLDELAGCLASLISRNFVIRADYGLYEYTTYVYR
jgi:hypothetical protein